MALPHPRLRPIILVFVEAISRLDHIVQQLFHLMQVFGLSESNPIVALDALSGNLKIVDFSNTNRSCGSLPCPSTPLSNYFGKYTTHTIS
jgi:hypothetical protein